MSLADQPASAPEVPASVLSRLATAIAAAPRPIVLVDGRSGSGKSTLAGALAAELGATLVRLDSLYPGWDGLDAGSRHVHDEILDAASPRWQAWDWAREAPGDWHRIDPDTPLVIEGSGALSAANRNLATFAIWVELADESERRTRALARDGAMYAPHWERWVTQEERFIARERPPRLADAVVDGSSWRLRFKRRVSLALEYFHPWPNSAGLYLARERDAYDAVGIDLELRTTDYARGDALAYLAAGAVDLGIFPTNRLLVRREQSHDVVALAAINQRGLETIRTRTDSGITRLRELEGRRLALNPTPRGVAIVRTLVRDDGGDPDRVILVDAGTRELDPATGFDGLADATFGSYWAWDNLLTSWPADQERVWRVDELLPVPYHSYLLGARRDWVAENTDLVADFLSATAAGYRDAAQDQDAATDAFLRAAPYFPRSTVQSSIAAIAPTWFHEGRWGVIRAGLIGPYAHWLAEHGILEQPDAWSDAIAAGVAEIEQ